MEDRKVDPKGIYIVLWNIADPMKFHWGLFIALDEKSGYIFHYKIGPKSNDKWVFQPKTYSFIGSITFLVGLKISEAVDIRKDMLDRIKERLEQVEFNDKQDNCRTWTLRAVRLLDQEGFMGLTATREVIEALQTETNQLAHECLKQKQAIVVPSRHYTP